MRAVPLFALLTGVLSLSVLCLPCGQAQASESDRRAEVVEGSGEPKQAKAEKAEGKADKADKADKGDKAEGKGDKADRADAKAEARAAARADTRPKPAVRPASTRLAASATPAAAAAASTGVAAVQPAGPEARDGRAVPPAATAAVSHGEPIAPVAQSFALGGGERGGDPKLWTYEGDRGPAAWAELAPEFAACANGTRQSPIDIREGIKVDLEPISFEYRESAFKVIDNGHTVQVNVAPGNAIRVMGRRFNLVQFHFHRPAEELLDGHAAEMVVHLLHRDADGKLAMVAVLLESGKAQSEVQAVWNNLPLEKNEEMTATGRIDLLHLLPEDRRYYTYMGSLTTPPCTEGVLWMVMKQPVTVSPAQIALFARLYPMNARPVQATSGRMIKESN